VSEIPDSYASVRDRISPYQALTAMFIFLEAYWRRGGEESDDLAGLLSGLAPAVQGHTNDPGLVGDFLAAVAQAQAMDIQEP
jgi:hypothetical protein